MSRGNERRPIFADDVDRRKFLATLRSVTERFHVLCHSYCLMNNHYHLVLETPDANVSLAIRQLNGVYAQSFNRRHRRVGHVFQGRFKAILVEKDRYLLALARYIVQNPVRAALVQRPGDWEWSSFLAHAGRVDPPPFLSIGWLLACFCTTDRRRAQEAYCSFVLAGPEDGLPETGPVVGSDEFVARYRESVEEVEQVEELASGHRVFGRPALAALLDACPDRPTRDARIRDAHLAHGYSMIEIARHLGLHRMTISRAVRGKK
jgi:REP element-mobilizing transposase RayT